ncbi:MAG: homoserine kinase, partial [Trichodesmium sp. St16_bin4-tuft]|nr:homoserine kinase [Trichodesmium sp. St16_bin4-tuft]
MTTLSSITVSVPATTANLGPGFDCLGAAISLYNRFKFSIADSPIEVKITVTGKEAPRVSTDRNNLAYQAFVKLYEYINQTPPCVLIEIDLGVPLARGLGSSATAIVGGLLGANQLAGSPLSQTEVMNLAIAIEGHPDNVVPALLGGCCLTASTSKGWVVCDIPWHPDIVPVVAIPDFELSTTEARRVILKEYSRADAIFNCAHLGILLRGLETGYGEWLQAGMQDKIHQPYRKSLIKGYEY